MTGFVTRLKQRKLAQWALAYIPAARVLLQVQGLATDSNDWLHGCMRIAFVTAPAWNGYVFDQEA